MRGDATLMSFARAIVQGERAHVSELLAGAPELALTCVTDRAIRRGAEAYFLDEIRHVVYAGDTTLHIAAAAYEAGIARALVNADASVASANRRGAQPLHYAVDGIPGSERWDPVAQRDMVLCLIELGADPNAADKVHSRAARALDHRPRRQRLAGGEGAAAADPPTPACGRRRVTRIRWR